MSTDALVRLAQRRFVAAADPAKAGPMAAYMKTTMAFYGVQSPQRRLIAAELAQRFLPADSDEYRSQVLALWQLPHREERYLAIDLAARHRAYVTFDNIDIYRRLIVEGAWWDLVDPVATGLVRRVLGSDPHRTWPVLEDWIDDTHMWLRRSALIAQVGLKQATDAARLFDFCLRRSHETEFFIRKAIGWALRELFKVDPQAVRRFLESHGAELSGLSRREASRHL